MPDPTGREVHQRRRAIFRILLNLVIVQAVVLLVQDRLRRVNLRRVHPELLLEHVFDQLAQGHRLHVAYERHPGAPADHAVWVGRVRVDGFQQPRVALVLLDEGVPVGTGCAGHRRGDAVPHTVRGVTGTLRLESLFAEHLERLDDDETPDDRVGGGHRVHDVTRHALGVEQAPTLDPVVGAPQRGGGGDELAGQCIILVERIRPVGPVCLVPGHDPRR